MRHSISLLTIGAVLSIGCGSDDEGKPAEPPPPPTVGIDAVQAVGGGSWSPGAAATLELGCDTEQRVVVAVKTTDWTMRPPGACSSLANCGYLLLRVDPDSDHERQAGAAAESVVFSMATLDAPTGSHVFRVELLGASSDTPAVENGEVVASEVTLDVSAPTGCP